VRVGVVWVWVVVAEVEEREEETRVCRKKDGVTVGRLRMWCTRVGSLAPVCVCVYVHVCMCMWCTREGCLAPVCV